MSQSPSHMIAANGVSASRRQENTGENTFLKAVPSLYKVDVTDAQGVLISAQQVQMHANIKIILVNVVPCCCLCICSIHDLPLSIQSL